mmetsp:Transcript_22952/g.32343  ORF Transcript_22952/g.32343 Transcript_22952/m.32343 type:complete len:545 (-) Transcript_22952:91-1725(-)
MTLLCTILASIAIQAKAFIISPAHFSNDPANIINIRKIEGNSRHLDSSTDLASRCNICGRLGNELLTDKLAYSFENKNNPNATCGFLQETVWKSVDAFQGIFPGETCRDFQEYFEHNCCDRTGLPMPYQCQQDTKSWFNPGNGFFAVPPLDESGKLDVGLFVYVNTVLNVDIKESTAEMFITFLTTWKDPRLAWNATAEDVGRNVDGIISREEKKGCATMIFARASSSIQESEIWVPDVDLLNLDTGVNSGELSFAKVYPDGTVLWDRRASIKAICNLQGMRRVPFDTMECQFAFGSNAYALNTLLYLGGSNGTGFEFGPEPFQTRSFVEFRSDEDLTKSELDSERRWVVFSFFFRRATRFYVLKIIIPSVIFTYISFMVFLMDIESGERIGLGIDILLLMVALDISTSDLLPICQEMMWINLLVYSNMYWVMIGVLESILVSILYYKASHHKKKENTDVDLNDEQLSIDSSIKYDNNNIDDNDGEVAKGGRSNKLISLFKSKSKLELIQFLDKIFSIMMPILFTIFIIVMLAINRELHHENTD